MVQITEKGKSALQRGRLTWQDVHADPDWLADRDAKKGGKKSELENEEVGIEGMSPQGRIDSGTSAIESHVQSELLDKLKSIDPYYFEKMILLLLEKMGYGDFVETPKSRDGGIDGIINEDKLGLGKIYMQAKRYDENKVRESDIRNFIGAMSGDTLKGIFVTTSSFDDGASKKARDAQHSIVL